MPIRIRCHDNKRQETQVTDNGLTLICSVDQRRVILTANPTSALYADQSNYC